MPKSSFNRLTVIRNRVLAALCVITMASCSPIVEQPNLSQGALLAEEGRVYALVETAADANRIRSSATDLGYSPKDTTDLDGLGLIMVSVDLPDNVTGAAAIAALEQAVAASVVGVNHAYRLQQSEAQPILASVQDRRSYANEMMLWPAGGCRAQHPVGLIDGGVDTTAPALADVSITSRNFAAGSPDSLRHGTEVASILADPTRLNGVSLYSANVIDTTDAGEDLSGAAALVLAIDWMARQDVGLVNVSLAGPPNKLLARAVAAAAEEGVQLVAAVGNNGPNAVPQHPAALPTVIAVTAVDQRSRVFRDAVRGTHVDFAAPGVEVFISTGSTDRYVSGTSIAAPFITSYLASRADRAPQAIVRNAVDLGATGRDTTFGYGLVQAVDSCN
jgi:hypothetical protein